MSRIILFLTLSGILFATIASISGCRSPADRSAVVSENVSGTSPIAGMWRCDRYELTDDSSHPLDGHISFGRTDWMVLFFVMNEQGHAAQGSGEGGIYTLNGDQLAFRYLRVLAGGEAIGSLPASPLRIEVLDASYEGEPEVCRVSFEGNRMTIHFPSDNRIRFTRVA